MICTAAVLAGGRAQRLGGRDKSALCVGAWSILDRQLAELRLVGDEILIVGTGARGDHDAPAGTRVVPDRQPGQGPLGGLYTALVEAAADPVLVLACDMPFVTAPFLRFLVDASRDVDAAVVRTADGFHPLCAAYARACAPVIRRRLESGRLKVIDFLEEVRVREITPQEVARYGREEMLLFNINTPDDYARAGTLAGSADAKSDPRSRRGQTSRMDG
jgi:molybdenum cofactor guanylyltransferase